MFAAHLHTICECLHTNVMAICTVLNALFHLCTHFMSHRVWHLELLSIVAYIFYVFAWKHYFLFSQRNQSFNRIFDLSQQSLDLLFIGRRIKRDFNLLGVQISLNSLNALQLSNFHFDG